MANQVERISNNRLWPGEMRYFVQPDGAALIGGLYERRVIIGIRIPHPPDWFYEAWRTGRIRFDISIWCAMPSERLNMNIEYDLPAHGAEREEMQLAMQKVKYVIATDNLELPELRAHAKRFITNHLIQAGCIVHD